MTDKKKTKTIDEENFKERNKKIITISLLAIVSFEVIRSYIGTILTSLLFLFFLLMFFKNKYPEQFKKYNNKIFKKTKSPKDLNKTVNRNKIEEYY